MKLIFSLSVLVTMLLLSSGPAIACSCGGTTSVCGSFAAAEAVFVGTVARVENQTAKDEQGREHIVSQVAYVQVDEAFKGVKQPELVFRSYGTSCDPEYEAGQHWLFYAYYKKEDKAWSIAACDRSSKLQWAADDLAYLRALPGSAQKTRIGGELLTSDYKPLMGVKVKLIGESKTYEVFTDKNGVYEAYGLPVGKYTIEPETPLNLKISFNSRSVRRGIAQVELKDKSCEGIDFFFTENTFISGRVFSVDGAPMRNVCLRLVPKEQQDTTVGLFDCTEADGRFMIDDVALGDYYLVANDDGVIDSDEPFPLTYFPGVLEKEKATVITFGSGDKLQDFDIHLPTQRPTRTIQGKLLFSDGRPVDDGSIEFISEEKPGQTQDHVNVTTDAEGRFKLSVLEGSRGTLHGYLYGSMLDADHCPQIDKLVKAYKDLETKRLKFEINRDYQDVELIFPFPYCAKAKEQE